MNCLLCQSSNTDAFTVEKNPVHNYFHCTRCELIFMDPEERPLPAEEKARYDLHQNEDTEGYRQFLEPLVQDIRNYSVMLAVPHPQVKILDFGCGPTAFLGKMLGEEDFRVSNYDIYYFPDQSPLQRSYDIITSTEVWEHFYHPHEEITQLMRLLKTFGLMAIMTSGHPGVGLFHNWQYRRDETHVIFFSEKTMRWIADEFNLDLIKAQSPYWIFQKKA
ncbi:class I SAM-dependent methyltransferase [Bdellovibrio sp. HCB337]|uniref:class I SAM-dependent methyltransferase n=1 Tax=Bdellovibrio sp. HCB337 TaxID=3394358 RepID=UPI0039A6A76D